LEGVFKNVLTNLESSMSENEARRVKLQREFNRKNQFAEEHLQRMIDN